MTFREIIDKIFQSYDVRGIYPDEYDGDIAYRIGRAVVAVTKAQRVIVGRDMRRGGHAILSALAMGAMDQGADVTDAGMCSSDALCYGGWSGKYDLSLMVTASHNPAEFIGTKFVLPDGTSLGRDSGLESVKEMTLSGAFPDAQCRGQISRTTVIPEFIEHAMSFIDPRKLKPFKIVVDAGNGMGGVLIEQLREHVPFRFVPMFFEPDGSFPNHDADPTRPECVRELRKRVLAERADLGLGFDGDADRCSFIDEKGERISGSELGALISTKLLEKHPGAKIAFCLVSSWIARDAVIEGGGQPVITPVGGANIRPIMKKQGVIFTSERSGHFYLAENNLADSGLIAALMVLEILSERGGSLSELIKPYRRYCMGAEFSLMLGTKNSTAVELAQIKARKIAKMAKLAKGARLVRCGADRYEFDDWWFCVRGSGTEPRKLRVACEATSKKLLREKFAEIKRLLKD